MPKSRRFTSNEAAAWLHVPKKTMHDLLWSGACPSFTANGERYVEQEQLVGFIRQVASQQA